MKRVLVLTLIYCLSGCHPGKTAEPAVQQQKNVALLTDTVHTAPKKQEPTVDTTVNRQTGDKIYLSFTDGNDPLLVKGHMDSIVRRVTCYLTINGAKKLSGSIESDAKNGNIRFNQVIFPDESSDGPFGKELTYDLPKKGTYKIVVGASLMADNPYSGDFILHLQLK